MAWTTTILVLLVFHIAWIWWELKHAPTINDDAGAEEKKEHLDEHVKTEEKAASD